MAAPKRTVLLTDVDGTLFNSSHSLSDGNAAALKGFMARGGRAVFATGKARGPWVQAVREKLGFEGEGWTMNAPAIFLQGLLVSGEDGSTLHQRTLEAGVVAQCLGLAKTLGVTIVLYTTDDRTVSHTLNEHTEKLLPYGEPAPDAVGEAGMAEYGVHDGRVYKLIFVTEEPEVAAMRDKVATALGDAASLTQAVPCMLEVLPLGASKKDGIERAIEHLGVSGKDCLAIGDGWNDLEMLKFVRGAGGVSVAVANAKDALKECAEFVSPHTNDDDAVAKAIEQWLV